jgi:phospholipase/lecithinase/hemolysin
MRVLRIALVLGFGMFAGCGFAVAQAANAAKIDKLYVFGDSYSDQGEGYLDADGPTAVVYFAQKMGLRIAPSNTEDPKYRSLNFAVSGAQTGSGLGTKNQGALIGYGMKNQVQDFVDQVHSSGIDFSGKSTLFFIAGGLNDSRLADGVTVANEEDLIRSLYKVGARRFAVALLTEKIPGFGKQGVRLNAALEKIPDELKGELPDAQIYVSRWGLFYDEVLTNPEKYGLTNTTDACAGRAIRNESTTPCATPATYFYYHAAHPSTATHKAVGEMLYAEFVEKTGVPAK